MSQATKKLKRFCAIIIVLGILLVLAGYFTGATKIPGWRDRLKMNAIQVKEDYPQEPIQSINLKFNCAKVILRTGPNFRIEASNIEKKSFVNMISNGIWTIGERSGWNFKFSNGLWPFSLGGNDGGFFPKVIIYVPADFQAENFNIEVGTGTVRIEKLVTTNNTAIRVGIGKVVIKEIQAYNTNIKCGTGSIYAKGIVAGNSKIMCSTGKVVIDLVGNEEDYSYSLACKMGKVSLNGRTNDSYSGVYEVKNLDAKSYFYLASNLGRVDLTVNKPNPAGE